MKFGPVSFEFKGEKEKDPIMAERIELMEKLKLVEGSVVYVKNSSQKYMVLTIHSNLTMTLCDAVSYAQLPERNPVKLARGVTPRMIDYATGEVIQIRPGTQI